ncbi:tRNA pseudouridine(55) synthase TruB [Moraxella catarrhalis]|uniref:tRNA pseudouridine(55) synthase TruB n=1 Tax=Moraxella catarrhalis TaxID=480 RepID=UPI00128B6A0A|nr:tRNA pseudouridine(55) synthase TruB [Moraxella catarrhalis]MPX76550.1 tRNA pseudouridine(55) synthase TruB [Moraxella catarrhalis]MPX78423.1 tRNA pseudouridine(55) synthase TruB [Moraxella catarrhalis]
MNRPTKKVVISGILLLDKPADISSHSALAKAKYLYQSELYDSKKAGHTGTLDPMATGLLPICFGEATKFAQYGLNADKSYVALLSLGVKTDTADRYGQVIQRTDAPSFNQQTLDGIAKALIGKQMQVPPMYSALKKDGKKLYEYARLGEVVERDARPIIIHNLTLTKLDNTTIKLIVSCSKGTYVRVLGESVAEHLDCVGHLTDLRRTATSGFDVADAVGLDVLSQLSLPDKINRLLPVDALMTHIPILSIDGLEAERLKMGQRLNVKDRLDSLLEFDDVLLVRLYAQDVFIGLAEVSNSGRLQPIKVVHCY